MRSLVAIFIFCVSQQSVALSVVYDNGNTVPAYRYVPAPLVSPPLPTVKPLTLAALDIPPSNPFTVGVVHQHRLANAALKNGRLFIIGDNAISRTWLQANAKTLLLYHAIGIIAMLQPGDTVGMLQALTPLPLIVANLNGLQNTIGTTHYPVMIANGWVVQ